MDRNDSSTRVRRLIAGMRAAHERGSRQCIRRMEVAPAPDRR